MLRALASRNKSEDDSECRGVSIRITDSGEIDFTNVIHQCGTAGRQKRRRAGIQHRRGDLQTGAGLSSIRTSSVLRVDLLVLVSQGGDKPSIPPPELPARKWSR